MPSADVTSADVGLLSPVWAGTRVAHATSDAVVIASMLRAEAALGHALADHDVIPGTAAEAIESASREGAYDMVSITVRSREGGNPLIPLLSDLRERVAAVDDSASRYVHRGATSQDIIDTALMMASAGAFDVMLADLESVEDSLARLADRYRDAVMAARTLTQHGVPTTFGLKSAGWLGGVLRAATGARSVRDYLPIQLGGASGTLSALAAASSPGRALEVVQSFADRLGLAAPDVPWHTDRTPVTMVADACVRITDALGKIATDVATLSRTEIGELAEGTGGGSSAMPQKRNPVRSVLIKSAHVQAPALAATLHAAAAPADERPDGDWHAEWAALIELLRLAGGAAELAADLAAHLTVDTERMGRNVGLSRGLIVSERLMLELAPEIGRDAVRRLVVRAAEGADLRRLLIAELGTARSGEIDDLLDPAQYLGASELIIDRTLARYESAAAARRATKGDA
ncbi:lyase family protein [Spelaeicoccus albus]|uniref:3-carboxy-cis,cis-muconate cycloisomerase n=1 Tax=Spelaeicoccus albus TaxID=1280376 RepID=A0A7Z0AAR1_9MICO|nr:lyase family protein [Spelaeicoccus albus]NYI66751.1 3-carboxy-cis,cis-muconate cycloisomerase [Spelaeicoccus albus]